MVSVETRIDRLRSSIESLETTLQYLKDELIDLEKTDDVMVDAAEVADDNSIGGAPEQFQKTDYETDQEKMQEKTQVQQWPLRKEEYQRYGRQMIVPEVGLQGQLNIKKARILIVGLGGLGCPAAAYLAGAGVGALGLVDGDEVELSNLHRQILHNEDRVGRSKVGSAVESLRGLNPNVDYQAHCEALTQINALNIFKDYDLVLDCTDHPTSRYLISDAAVLAGKPLISASALQAEGQMLVLNNPPKKDDLVDADANIHQGFCYRCVFPKPPPAESVKTCGEGGILGPVVGVMGVLMATEALKLTIWPSQPGATPPSPTMLLYRATDPTPFRTVRLKGRRAGCIACSDNATLTPESLASGSLDYATFCGINTPVDILTKNERISAQDYNQLISTEKPYNQHILIDVREQIQFNICHLPGSINVPLSSFTHAKTSPESTALLKFLNQAIHDLYLDTSETNPYRPPNELPLYFICRFGNDSQAAARMVKRSIEDYLDAENDPRGSWDVKDVRGGLHAWTKEVDPGFPEY